MLMRSFLHIRMLKQNFFLKSCTQTCNFSFFLHSYQRAIRAAGVSGMIRNRCSGGEKGGNRTTHEGGSMTGTPGDRMRSGILTTEYFGLLKACKNLLFMILLRVSLLCALALMICAALFRRCPLSLSICPVYHLAGRGARILRGNHKRGESALLRRLFSPLP